MTTKQNKRAKPSPGPEILRGLQEVCETIEQGVPLSRRFTVRTVRMADVARRWTPAQVRVLRERLGASQGVFARVIGASIKTVQSWEQGKTPPAIASRLLECIESDPRHWERMLHNAAITRRAS